MVKKLITLIILTAIIIGCGAPAYDNSYERANQRANEGFRELER